MKFMHDVFYWLLILSFLMLGLLGFMRPKTHQTLARFGAWGWGVAGLIVILIVMFDSSQSWSQLRFGFAEAMVITVGLAMMFLPSLAHEKMVISFFSPYWCVMTAITLIIVMQYPSRHLIQLSSLSSDAHFVLSMLSHATFTLWALINFLHLLQMTRLHHPSDVDKLRRLPPLLAIEKQGVWLGRLTAILLSAALITGFFYAEASHGVVFNLNHKLLFSGLAWLGVISIVAAQILKGWRGKRVNIAVLVCYAFLLLGYIGSQFVREVLLGR